MAFSIGVIDEPVAPGAADNLDINIHSRSLIRFIDETNTPITVGIQGEWGSGKTSLINSITMPLTVMRPSSRSGSTPVTSF